MPTYADYQKQENFLSDNTPPSVLPDPAALKDPLEDIANGISASFITYNTAAQKQIKEEKAPVSIAEAIAITVAVAIGLRWVFKKNATDLVSQAMMLNAPGLPKETADQLSEVYLDQLLDELDETTIDAIIKAFEAELANNTVPSIAWERVIKGYGLDERSLRAYMDAYAKNQYRSNTNLDNKVFDALFKRSMVIGENEAFAASQTGKSISWLVLQSNGVIPEGSGKRWVTSNDELVCPICRPLDGVVVGLSDQFDTGQGKVWAPDAHVNCRCDIELDIPEEIEKMDYWEKTQKEASIGSKSKHPWGSPEYINEHKAWRKEYDQKKYDRLGGSSGRLGELYTGDDHWKDQRRDAHGRWINMNQNAPKLKTLEPPRAVDTKSKLDTKMLLMMADLDAINTTNRETAITSTSQLQQTQAPLVKTLDSVIQSARDEYLQTVSSIATDAYQKSLVDQAIFMKAMVEVRAQQIAEAKVQTVSAEPEAEVEAEVETELSTKTNTKTKTKTNTGLVVAIPASYFLNLRQKAINEKINAYDENINVDIYSLPKDSKDLEIGSVIDFDAAKKVSDRISSDRIGFDMDISSPEKLKTLRDKAKTDFALQGMTINNGSLLDVVRRANADRRDYLEGRNIENLDDQILNSIIREDHVGFVRDEDSMYYEDESDAADRFRSLEETRKELRQDMYDQLSDTVMSADNSVDAYVRQMSNDDIMEVYGNAGINPPVDNLREEFINALPESFESNSPLFASLDDWNFEANAQDFAASSQSYGRVSDYLDSEIASTLAGSTVPVFIFETPNGTTTVGDDIADVNGRYKVSNISIQPLYDFDIDAEKSITYTLTPLEDND